MNSMNSMQQEQITNKVTDILNEHYNGSVQFDAVHTIPDEDINGEDNVRIIVVFSEDKPALGALGVGAKTEITLQILEYLHGEGLTHFPVPYFIGKSDWPKFEKWLIYDTA